VASTIPNCEEYTVGWICATHTENAAAQEFLDEEHEGPESVQQNDNNIYTLGRIGKHNVVIAALPHKQYGLVNAASVARDMVHSFPNIKIGLLVGVGGGVPSATHDIRLGDVVVSSAGLSSGGVFQHDYGKKKQDEDLATTGFLNQPPMILLNAIQALRTKHERKGHQIQDAIEAIFQNNKRLRAKYKQPDRSTDRLYESSFTHAGSDNDSCMVVCGDDSGNLISRTERAEEDDDPTIHYGLIASGNQLLKDAQLRDKLALEREILCFEMEAAGLMNHFPCLVIRGISDYCDTHKSKQWQGYASMAAAAYAKELLSIIAPNKIDAEAPLIQSMAQDISEIKDVMTQVGANQVSQIERKILDWITDITYGNEHSDIRNKRLPKTSEWLLKTKEYHDWVSNSGKTLYCEGMPGAGKTIIASVIVDDLDRPQNENGIAYIYCNYKREETQTVENLLKTMVRQLLQTRTPLPEAVKSLYNRHNARQTQLTLEEIRRLLRSTVASYPRVFIVIDALDECLGPDECRSRYLQEIRGLQESYAVNVFVTSRPLPKVRKMPSFKDSALVQLHARGEDIQAYLDYRISRFSSFVQQDIDLQRAIKDKIQGIVNGMFLLAKLYMDAIQDKVTSNSVKDATSAFGTNPDVYSEAYEAAIERIESQKSDRLTYAKKLLSWICLAKRELSVSELEHALAVEPGAKAIDKGDIPDIHDVVSFCAGLVNIHQTSQIVKLVHSTAQTFLESKRAEFSPNAESSIARICITYQCFDAFTSGYCATDQEYEERIQNYPLFSYAAHYWGQHTRNSKQFDHALLLLKQTAHIQGSFQTLSIGERPFKWEGYSQKLTRDIVALHLLAYLGLDELIGEIAEAEIDAESSDGRTPLWAAAAQGHEAVARLLVERGAAINPKGNIETPLFTPAYRGQEAVARVLIDHGATINPTIKEGFWTPLFAAVSQGHEAVARLLIGHGARVETGCEPVNSCDLDFDPLGCELSPKRETPLLITSRGKDNVVTRQLLVEHGAAVDSNNSVWMPLWAAVGQGSEAVVRLLVEHGADINLHNSGWTPLLAAANRGHEAMMSLLIEHVANIDHNDNDGRTSLFIAASQGHEAVYNNDGETPLISAASRGHKAVVELLIKHGAAINKADKNGQTPPAAATIQGHKAVERLLVKHGSKY
ncbi:unnamed protein product, partial [Clonostachys solani]